MRILVLTRVVVHVVWVNDLTVPSVVPAAGSRARVDSICGDPVEDDHAGKHCSRISIAITS
jgi:hypothetical protein